ncbi:MAG: protoheme IX farnesyltransferase [Firmicutes bacterium]|nr:protoheme IX farnesyltransferase [Bacillota bacterium]
MNAAAVATTRPSPLALLLELTKFRISVASTFTAAMGYIAFRQGVDLPLLSTLVGTLSLAMASSALNEIQERHLDARMERTRHRPLPSGAVKPLTALAVVGALTLLGLGLLWRLHGLVPAALGLLAMGWYNGLYTPLKRVSAFAVVPGSLIGALPPAIGWTAAGGALGDPALLALCFVFFVWQVPHFWLLALLHAESYAQADFPTLTKFFTPEQILRLTFTWTCGTLAAGALLPLFHATRGLGAVLILAAASLWLLLRFTRLLRPDPNPALVRRAFMDINLYALALMIAVISAALGLP